MKNMNELINDPRTNLIDVRSPEEVEEVSVAGARNIPLHTIPDHVDDFRAMEGPIVVFCRSGARSEQAKKFLEQQGLTDVTNAGGYADVQIHKM